MPARRRDRSRSFSRKIQRRTGDAPPGAINPGTTVSIDRRAGTGRGDLAVGDRVRIVGSGLFAGETAVIERLTGSVVPAAFVRTEGGRTRQVRTIDLEPVGAAHRRTPDASARTDSRVASAADVPPEATAPAPDPAAADPAAADPSPGVIAAAAAEPVDRPSA